MPARGGSSLSCRPAGTWIKCSRSQYRTCWSRPRVGWLHSCSRARPARWRRCRRCGGCTGDTLSFRPGWPAPRARSRSSASAPGSILIMREVYHWGRAGSRLSRISWTQIHLIMHPFTYTVGRRCRWIRGRCRRGSFHCRWGGALLPVGCTWSESLHWSAGTLLLRELMVPLDEMLQRMPEVLEGHAKPGRIWTILVPAHVDAPDLHQIRALVLSPQVLNEFRLRVRIHNEIVALAEVLVVVAVLVNPYPPEMVDIRLTDQPLLLLKTWPHPYYYGYLSENSI